MDYSNGLNHKNAITTRSEKEMSDIEDAFKTDFTKKPPSFSCKTSLLTTMFEKQHHDEDDHRPEEGEEEEEEEVEQNISNNNDELSASLKQNVDWEHQSTYSIKPSNSNYTQIDWNDNFSRW